MNKLIITLLFLSIIFVVTGCTEYEYKNYQSANSKVYNLSITNSGFNPNILEIKKGDTVKWTNLDTSIQTITPDINDDLEGNVLLNGQDFNYTFNRAGTYKYHSKYNKNMSGIIIVE